MTKSAKEKELLSYKIKMDLYEEIVLAKTPNLSIERTESFEDGPITTIRYEFVHWQATFGFLDLNFFSCERNIWGNLKKVECDSIPDGKLFLIEFKGRSIDRMVGEDFILPVFTAGQEIYTTESRSYSQKLASYSSNVVSYFWQSDIDSIKKEFELYRKLSSSGLSHNEIVGIMKKNFKNWKKPLSKK